METLFLANTTNSQDGFKETMNIFFIINLLIIGVALLIILALEFYALIKFPNKNYDKAYLIILLMFAASFAMRFITFIFLDFELLISKIAISITITINLLGECIAFNTLILFIF